MFLPLIFNRLYGYGMYTNGWLRAEVLPLVDLGYESKLPAEAARFPPRVKPKPSPLPASWLP